LMDKICLDKMVSSQKVEVIEDEIGE
jgi:hypothetical protein